jgi:hypothetical protein
VESLRETVAKGKTLAESAAELKYVSSIYNFLSNHYTLFFVLHTFLPAHILILLEGNYK